MAMAAPIPVNSNEHSPRSQVQPKRFAANRWCSDLVQNAFDALPLPARLRIDVYDGPLGQGWAATLQVLYSGTVYERTANVGPETWRTSTWHVADRL